MLAVFLSFGCLGGIPKTVNIIYLHAGRCGDACITSSLGAENGSLAMVIS
ncbi:MAG: hypothetical protein KBS41_00110 [Oscillospiraceae bacterium]|nr:hypothetical protein [Candidatus Equicaccousia limihippi]